MITRPLDCKIGNGQRASFWFDKWSSFGPLIKFIGEDGPRALRIPIHSTVAAACDVNGWRLAPSRSANAMRLHAYLSSTPSPLFFSEGDLYSWVAGDFRSHQFSTAKTWEVLRPRNSLKEWSSSVWFKGVTPKNAFTMWVAQLDRLPTRSRLSAWGLPISSACCL